MAYNFIKALFLILFFVSMNPPEANAVIWDALYQPGGYPEGSLKEDEIHAYSYKFPFYGFIATEKAELLNTENYKEVVGNIEQGRKVKIIGRSEKGMPLAGHPYYKDAGPFVELFKVELEGGKVAFIKAIDIAREYKTYYSPQKKIKIVSDVIGSSFHESDGSYLTDWGYWLSFPENKYIYLGSGALFTEGSGIIEWSPDEKFIYVLLRNEQIRGYPEVQWPVSRIFSSSGEVLWKFSKEKGYLTSPVWLPDEQVLLRGIQYDDTVYLIELESGRENAFIKFFTPPPYKHILENPDEITYRWPPALFNAEKGTITATFSRVKKYSDAEIRKLQLPGWVKHKRIEITIVTDMDGLVLSSTLKAKGPYETKLKEKASKNR